MVSYDCTLLAAAAADDGGTLLGRSRENRPVYGRRIGAGPRQVSLIAGAHADEPVGPLLLRKLCTLLDSLPPGDPLLARFTWWIVPHANPDGAARNQRWFPGSGERIMLSEYLQHAVREQPGDDVEFGFPRDAADSSARPENRAIAGWWRKSAAPFMLHASLHSMAFAGGAWFLIDRAWVKQSGALQEACRSAVQELGWGLHDVERRGEKGFTRIAPGFCTRPDSEAMRRYFVERGEPDTAAKFRPSSMEHIRSLGGNPLTLVSELPFFILPGVGRDIGPPDASAEQWKMRIEQWSARLAQGENGGAIDEEAAELGVKAMPLCDQMLLQWRFIEAGLRLTK